MNDYDRWLDLEYARFFQSLEFDEKEIVIALECIERACCLSQSIKEVIKHRLNLRCNNQK